MTKLPALSIPRPLRKTVEVLDRLTEDQFRDLAGFIATVDPTVSSSTVAVPPESSGITADDVGSLLDLAAAVHSLARLFSAGLPDVATAMTEGAKELNSEVVVARLQALAATRSVVLRSDARSLDGDHQSRFRSARVLSDVRPRFERGLTSIPAEAIITHTLKLEYVGNEATTLYVAMSRADLESVAEMIKRALEKDDALSTFLDRAGLINLTPAADV